MKRTGPVEVTWEDAASHTGWQEREEGEAWADGAFLVTSVGYVTRRSARALTISQSRTARGTSAGDQVDHLLRIPRGMVRKVRRL